MQDTDTAAQTTPTQAERECPVCHAPIPVYLGYVIWCDRCNWNVQPTPPEKPSSFFATFYERLGRKMSNDLFDEVMEQPRLKPTLTLSITLAYAIATVVHLITLLIAGIGIVLLIVGWRYIPVVIFALLFLGVAWVMRPRFTRMPPQILAYDDIPALYSILNRVAEALESPPTKGIVINSAFNASLSQHGLSQKRLLTIGLPLFCILTVEEKIALIAHELAHSVNGDPQRRFIIHTALDSLLNWAYIVRPSKIFTPMPGFLVGIIAGFAMVPINLALIGLSNLFAYGAYGLLHLLYRDSQRAEYLADHLASTVAGTSHLLSLLEKLYSANHLQMVTQRFVLGRQQGNLFVALQQAVNELPERERERLRRVNLFEQARLDTSHPPTVYRVAFLQAVPTTQPKIILSPQEEKQLDELLARLQPAIQERIVDTFIHTL